MTMRRTSLLTFNPIEVVCYNANSAMSTFEININELLNSLIKVTCTGYWILLNKFALLLTCHFLYLFI